MRAGAEVLGGLGAAGDREAQAVLRRAAPSKRAATKPARKASPEPTAATGSSAGAVTS